MLEDVLNSRGSPPFFKIGILGVVRENGASTYFGRFFFCPYQNKAITLEK